MGFRSLSGEGFKIDGKGYVIKNLYINRQRNNDYSASLFSVLQSAEIVNLGLVDCDITGKKSAAGFCLGLFYSTIENCFVTGKVRSIDGIAAGFCAYLAKDANIINSYATCNVISTKYASSFYVYRFGDFYCCYTAGTINSPNSVQPFDTNYYYGSAFWDTETTGVIDSVPNDEFFGRTTAEMMRQSTYDNDSTFWDFERVWCIDEGKSYPKLRVFGNCTEIDVPEPVVNRNDISFYPNPASELLTIKYPTPALPKGEGVEIEVYNVLGEIVQSQTLTASQSLILAVDISSFPPGIYYISLKAGGERITRQFGVVR